jgi:hypothetical protein
VSLNQYHLTRITSHQKQKDPNQKPQMSYYHLYFSSYQDNQQHRPLWTWKTDNLELLAGMLAISPGIIYDLNTYSDRPNQAETFYLDSNTDLSSFRVMSEIFEDDIEKCTRDLTTINRYGLWLRGQQPFCYSLYRFSTSVFLQGILTLCQTFEVDFRSYLSGLPFSLSSQGGKIRWYTLDTYVIYQRQLTIDVPDSDDVEIEEQDDENIEVPLERTDDIVTFTDEIFY